MAEEDADTQRGLVRRVRTTPNTPLLFPPPSSATIGTASGVSCLLVHLASVNIISYDTSSGSV